ncbi:MAG: AraC family transcriptional regulator [Desulfovibrio sp.]|nr:AraC family transcriptional regulator [Desulfovibrio sp.]
MPAESAALLHDADLEADAFSFRLTARAFAPHYHPAWVLGCVLDGVRRFWVRGREYRAGAGDVVILRPGEVHACAPESGAPFVWRGFHFREGSAAAALLESLTRDEPTLEPVCAGAGVLNELLAVHALMGGPTPAEDKRSRLLAALARLGRCDRKPDADHAAPTPTEPALEALRTHLAAHAGERVSLEDMAVMAHMGKFRLVRAFARMTGATPYRYLESARVNRAQELLAQGLPPAEAALESGFADQSHLSRAFRTRLGVTPGACRRHP